MSTAYIRLIPTDVSFTPTPDALRRAEAAMGRILKHSPEVRAVLHDSLQFVDPGVNLESIACPSCGATLTFEWWQQAMDLASRHQFRDLSVTPPCCSRQTTLNDLAYDFPAGFARFVLEARDPNVPRLPKGSLRTVEDALGCTLREVLAHY